MYLQHYPGLSGLGTSQSTRNWITGGILAAGIGGAVLYNLSNRRRQKKAEANRARERAEQERQAAALAASEAGRQEALGRAAMWEAKAQQAEQDVKQTDVQIAQTQAAQADAADIAPVTGGKVSRGGGLSMAGMPSWVLPVGIGLVAIVLLKK
jgi:hypothetical protein